ncbi:hypothetical protein IEQ34_014998 [Dendrobium chrysotoxum]|uniref:C2H2-type domain-containing protein n=1 Tax=Dendrobium chrysotoxum TaxID=161865 RepID=A0AAV7GKU7_DENCH|nr:hypothetical protein IEQ34_014998 [Dendrobium chrysotoxum]
MSVSQTEATSMILVFRSTRVDFVHCPIVSCGARLSCLEDFEDHYHARHMSACAICSRVYPTSRLLSIHVSEAHDSFFAAKVAHGFPMIYHFLYINELEGMQPPAAKMRAKHEEDIATAIIKVFPSRLQEILSLFSRLLQKLLSSITQMYLCVYKLKCTHAGVFLEYLYTPSVRLHESCGSGGVALGFVWRFIRLLSACMDVADPVAFCNSLGIELFAALYRQHVKYVADFLQKLVGTHICCLPPAFTCWGGYIRLMLDNYLSWRYYSVFATTIGSSLKFEFKSGSSIVQVRSSVHPKFRQHSGISPV